MISKKDQHTLQKFGRHLRSLREKKGLSLRGLSAVCNIDNSKISKIEAGKINITLITLLCLAKALEITTMELIGFEKEASAC